MLAVLAFVVVVVTMAVLEIIDLWETNPYEECDNVE